MLKFVKHNLENIDGVSVFPIISLMIFFIFFILLFGWVITAKKSYIDEVSNIPFDKSKTNEPS